MEKNSIRRSFSLQEAVVLLDTYIEANENGLSLTRTAEKASARLRAIAIRNGESIDDGFRSPAGLLNRIRSIAALYSGTKSESAPGTKAFSEAVVLYREEREEYEKILKAALGDKPAQKQKPAPKVMKRNRATKINKTRFVRNAKDQELIAMYGDSLRATYYALKRLTGNGKENASATDVFVELKKAVQRKVIIEILSAASWAKEVTASHYMFYDAEQEERGRKRMEEQIKANEIAFFQWLPSAVSPFIVNEILDSYVRISTMLLQTKLIPGPLASITTINQIEAAQRQVKRVFGSKKNRNLASKALSAYVSYLREKKNSVVKKEPEPAIDIQENWIKFTFTNAASFERTAPAYCAVAGQIITGKSWARILVELVELEIKKDNPGLSELYKKPLIINRANRPFFLKEQIKGLSCAQVSTGYWINLNYGVPTLLEIIQLFCLQCGYTKNQILIYGVPKSSASAGNGKANESRQSGNRMDILKAEEYLLSPGLAGATVQKLIAAVQPSAAVAPTRKALEESRNIISMPKNRYVHADAFVDLDEAEEILSEILKTHFAEFGGYSNSILLYGAAALDMSMFLNDNNCDNADSVFSIARFLFEKKAADENPYKFASPHIFETEPDFPLSLKGLMINFARHNGGILNADEAKNYLQKTMLTFGSIGQLLQIYSDSTFLMYDESRYLLTEAVGIDDAWLNKIHNKLDNLFRQADVAYVVPRDINSAWFDTLPSLPMGMRWTMLLLQEVIKKVPSIGFKVVKSELEQPYCTVAAALVPDESQIQSFPDVVSLYMQEHHQLPQKMTCEDLRIELREAGMLEGNELIYSLYRALDDYRFAWTDENKTVLVRGN